jgi:hypothetical protein
VIETLLSPIPQPLTYHLFADQRTLFGVPNALDVLSNLAFAVAGAVGLAIVLRGREGFSHSWDRWPYGVLFLGVMLTSVGSSYYHLAPDNARLVWDRLPMTVGFVSLLGALMAERVDRGIARRLFIPLLTAGALSVAYWYWSELRGAGDLRPYLVVQFGSLLLVLLVLVRYPARGRDTRYLIAGLVAYGAAKGLEAADGSIFLALGNTVSGHTLKHLVAAGGIACVVAGLKTRDHILRSRASAVPAAFRDSRGSTSTAFRSAGSPRARR